MAEKKGAKKGARKSAKSPPPPPRAARLPPGLRTRNERRCGTASKSSKRRENGDEESTVLEKIAAMQGADRAMGERIHALVKAAAPGLSSRLWYGMPAYAKDGQVVCFFQDARKFKSRYATLGFSDKAKLDDGQMWPTTFALKDLTAADEARIIALVKKAVS